MSNKIQFKRGLKANIPALSMGEPALCTDTNEFFIGTATGNKGLVKDTHLSESNAHSKVVTITSKPIVNDFKNIVKESYTVQGSTTAGTPTTGYSYTDEIIPHLVQYNTDAGHNESDIGDSGRTGQVVYSTRIEHVGQGDVSAYNASVTLNTTNPTAENWMAFPAGVILNGDVGATVDGVYINPIEYNMEDNGHDCGAGGLVINSHRYNDTGSKGAKWIVQRLQSVGTKFVNCCTSIFGKYKVGIDFTTAELDTDKVAIAMKANDKIYYNAVCDNDAYGTKWVMTNKGNAYTMFDSSESAYVLNVGANKILKCNETDMYINGNTRVNGNQYMVPNTKIYLASGVSDTYLSYNGTNIVLVKNGVQVASW